MKLVSRNVNGIRANIKKGTFFDYLKNETPDIIGLQEVKAKFDQLEENDVLKIKEMGYEIYWNEAVRPGYSGTAILSKIKPKNIFYGIDIKNMNIEESSIDEVITKNTEGRVLSLEFNDFYFLNVYTPNSKRDLERLNYRKVWDDVFLKYTKFLEIKKPVIFCGDLNVAHTEIDLANPGPNKTTDKKPGNAGFTDTERAGMQNYLDYDFVDTFRYFYPKETGKYSWWSNFGKSREKNVGWRIDYFLVSNSFKGNLKNAFIQSDVMGSDHCPIGIEIL